MAGISARIQTPAPATSHAATGRSQRNSRTRDCPARNAPMNSDAAAPNALTTASVIGSFGSAGPALPNPEAIRHAAHSPSTVITTARRENTAGAYLL